MSSRRSPDAACEVAIFAAGSGIFGPDATPHRFEKGIHGLRKFSRTDGIRDELRFVIQALLCDVGDDDAKSLRDNVRRLAQYFIDAAPDDRTALVAYSALWRGRKHPSMQPFCLEHREASVLSRARGVLQRKSDDAVTWHFAQRAVCALSPDDNEIMAELAGTRVWENPIPFVILTSISSTRLSCKDAIRALLDAEEVAMQIGEDAGQSEYLSREIDAFCNRVVEITQMRNARERAGIPRDDRLYAEEAAEVHACGDEVLQRHHMLVRLDSSVVEQVRSLVNICRAFLALGSRHDAKGALESARRLLQILAVESGSYDPADVEALRADVEELEQQVRSKPKGPRRRGDWWKRGISPDEFDLS